MSSREALQLLAPWGFKSGKDLSRILYSEHLPSLSAGDVKKYIKKLKENRLYTVYGEEMSDKQIAKELLVEESVIAPLLQVRVLKSHSTRHVQELLDREHIEICRNRVLFGKLYQLIKQIELADLCGCTLASINLYSKKYGITRGYKMPKQIVAVNLNNLNIIKKYPSLNAMERETGLCRKSVAKNASKPIKLLANGTICGAFGDIRYFFINALEEGLRELRKLKKEKKEWRDIPHSKKD